VPWVWVPRAEQQVLVAGWQTRATMFFTVMTIAMPYSGLLGARLDTPRCRHPHHGAVSNSERARKRGYDSSGSPSKVKSSDRDASLSARAAGRPWPTAG
jgi:hypothetical protein